MKQQKNGVTKFNAADIASLAPGAPETDGTMSLLAAIAGAPDPIRHPDEFKAWLEASDDAREENTRD